MANPDTFNNLYNVKFKLDIHRMPNVTFWVQSCTLPTMQLENTIMPGMRRDAPIPGHKMEFEAFTVNFMVDQYLHNYEEVYSWFQEISGGAKLMDMISDCSLHFLDGNNAIARTMDLVGAYPMLLSELAMNSDDTDLVPVTCSLTFNYQYFKFSKAKLPIWAVSKGN